MLFLIIIVTALIVFYCEIMWRAVILGHRPYKYMKDFLAFTALFNYILSFIFSSWGTVILAIVASLYSMVIYPRRYALITEGIDDDSTDETEK
jgi:hypothetical protein